jgi:hypothetical protein
LIEVNLHPGVGLLYPKAPSTESVNSQILKYDILITIAVQVSDRNRTGNEVNETDTIVAELGVTQPSRSITVKERQLSDR